MDSDEEVGVGDGCSRSIFGEIVEGELAAQVFPEVSCIETDPWPGVLSTPLPWTVMGLRLIAAMASDVPEEGIEEEKLLGLIWMPSSGSPNTGMLE